MKRLALALLLTSACSASPVAEVQPEPIAVPAAVAPVEQSRMVLPDSVGVYDTHIFYGEELEALGTAVATRLGSGEFGAYTVPSYPEQRKVWKSLRAGNYPNGKVCADPPGPAHILGALNSDALTMTTSVICSKSPGCVLRVILADPNLKKDREVSRWEVALPEDPATWANAVATQPWVQPPPPDPAGGLGILGSLSGGQPRPQISTRDIRMTGPWASDKLDTSVLEPAVPVFAACHQQVESSGKIWRDWWGMPLTMSVDPSGTITRCEGTIEDHQLPPAFVCKCRALQEFVKFPPARGERRIKGYFDYYEPKPPAPSFSHRKDGLYRSAYLSSEATGDDPLSAALAVNALPYAALEACKAHINDVFEVEVPVTFALRENGEVESVAVNWPGVIPKAFAACATPILKTARFSCPMGDSATITTNLHVGGSYPKPVKLSPQK